MTFGAFIKDARIDAGLTLRGFCKIMHADPGNWSKIDAATRRPPRAIRSFGRSPRPSIWLRIRRHGTISSIWPASVSFPANSWMTGRWSRNSLIFFRTLRGEKPARKELEDLIQKIKRN